jgi:hypothetical protein
LRTVDLYQSQVTDAGVAELSKLRPDFKITH